MINKFRICKLYTKKKKKLCNLQSNVICVALACCDKYTYDVQPNIHTDVQVVLEAVTRNWERS